MRENLKPVETPPRPETEPFVGAPKPEPARPRISLDLALVESEHEAVIDLLASLLLGRSQDPLVQAARAAVRAVYVDLAGARFDQRMPKPPGRANGGEAPGTTEGV